MFVDSSFFEAIQRFNMALQAMNSFVEMNSSAMKFAAKEKGCFPAAGRRTVYHTSSLMYDRRKAPFLFFRRARPPPKKPYN